MAIDSLKHIKNVLQTKINLSNQIIENEKIIKNLKREKKTTEDKVKKMSGLILKVERNQKAKKKLARIEDKIFDKKFDKTLIIAINIIFPITLIFTSPTCNKKARKAQKKARKDGNTIWQLEFQKERLEKVIARTNLGDLDDMELQSVKDNAKFRLNEHNEI